MGKNTIATVTTWYNITSSDIYFIISYLIILLHRSISASYITLHNEKKAWKIILLNVK